MSTRLSVVLRRALVRGPAIVLVPALAAGTLVASAGAPKPAREDRPRTTKVATEPGAGEFVPLTPTRILDTRTASQPLTGTSTRVVSLVGGSVPTTGVSASSEYYQMELREIQKQNYPYYVRAEEL